MSVVALIAVALAVSGAVVGVSLALLAWVLRRCGSRPEHRRSIRDWGTE